VLAAPLDGRVTVIAGAGNGMGRATALLFAQAGAEVAVVARSAARLEATAAQITGTTGRDPLVLAADLVAPEAAARVTQAVLARWGRLDAVLVNAGTSGHFDLDLPSTPREVEDEMIDLNLRTAVNTARATLPALSERSGSLILVAAAPKTLLWPNTMYAATKSAVLGLTTGLAREWWPRVRVNSISPGSIRRVHVTGPIAPIEGTLDRGGRLDDVMHFGGEPADIAHAALFLAGPASSWITGVDLPVDGGAHLRW
jgi:NAD(P)-dependent dehydrogenase (short-subunit alcohol dehydrogenase family)